MLVPSVIVTESGADPPAAFAANAVGAASDEAAMTVPPSDNSALRSTPRPPELFIPCSRLDAPI
jgi:hypothetical protein